MNKIMDEQLYKQVSLRKKIIFWLTCWTPISRYEFLKFQLTFISIFEGLKDSDMQHYQIEKTIIDDVKKLATAMMDKKVSDNKTEDKGMYR